MMHLEKLVVFSAAMAACANAGIAKAAAKLK